MIRAARVSAPAGRRDGCGLGGRPASAGGGTAHGPVHDDRLTAWPPGDPELDAGKWDDLERYAHEMISLSDQSDESWWRRHGERTLALRDLLDGRCDQA